MSPPRVKAGEGPSGGGSEQVLQVAWRTVVDRARAGAPGRRRCPCRRRRSRSIRGTPSRGRPGGRRRAGVCSRPGASRRTRGRTARCLEESAGSAPLLPAGRCREEPRARRRAARPSRPSPPDPGGTRCTRRRRGSRPAWRNRDAAESGRNRPARDSDPRRSPLRWARTAIAARRPAWAAGRGSRRAHPARARGRMRTAPAQIEQDHCGDRSTPLSRSRPITVRAGWPAP